MNITKLPPSLLVSVSDTLNQPTPWVVGYLGYIVPYAITYLVYIPNTRLFRMALYPFGLIVMIWVILTRKGEATHVIRCVSNMVLANACASTRYAFTETPPKSHALPRTPYWSSLRNTTAFKALDLHLNEYRHINVPPNPPLRSSKRSYMKAVLSHLGWAYFHLLMMDLSTFPAFRIAPHTFGSPEQVGGNFGEWCGDLALRTGIPRLWIRMFWTLDLAMITYQGMACIWQMVAFVGVASGIYADEEWSSIMSKPWLSTSLNEFWSIRYHQTLKDCLILFATPFSILPRPLHLLSIFAISALLHSVYYYPLQHKFTVYPYAAFFLSCGVGCMLERQYYQITGRRVGGVYGLIWFWAVMLSASVPLVDYEWSSGWAGVMRGELARNPTISTVEWVIWYMGAGLKPVKG